MQRYKNLYYIIAIYIINNFTNYKILNKCMKIASNSFRYYTTNNFEKLLEEKVDLEKTVIITILILVKIRIYIRSRKFLNANSSGLVYS